MDRTQILGFILIITILFTWMWMTAPQQTKQAPKKEETTNKQNTEPIIKEIKQRIETSQFFKENTQGVSKSVIIETDNYIAEIQNNNGTIKSFELKKYKSWGKKYNVQLINDTLGGDLDLRFMAKDGKEISTKNLFFDFENINQKYLKLVGKDEKAIHLSLKTATGKITKTLIFNNNDYTIDLNISIENANEMISNYEYQLEWTNGLRYTEVNSIAESQATAAHAFTGGELVTIDAATVGETININPTGATNWVATHNKYFATSLISKDKKSSGCYINGTHESVQNFGSVEKYSIALKFPISDNKINSINTQLYVGPMDLAELKKADDNLGQIIYLGWSWIRPLSEYIFIPLFSLLQFVTSNFGIVIILFTIVIKLALFPLSRKSMLSMKKMRALQPIINELKEKLKSDPSQLNIQTMKLYKDYGVNPAGGCLPLLLQMPILYSLYSLFSNSIELRQADFMLWINDLSIPDVIFSLPFRLPLVGLQDISGLALMMAIAMFIQQKMTIQDPSQKAIVYIMPPMMFLLFNFFPAGLNLYYLAYNILSLGEQIYFTKLTKPVVLTKVERKNKAPGFMEKLMHRAQEQAERQKKKR
ncbi:MAG: membrane protein insertase YidC [Bacteroidetes bacterium]|nr:membrane protein insertase YidC [Bacteroidota bacterium]